MQIRRFTPDQHQAVERKGARNVTSLPIQVPVAILERISADQLAERVNGAPLLGEANMGVIALHIGPHGHIDEHAAPYPITCLVIGGHGFMRIGGPNGETVEVHAGDALLWPANEPTTPGRTTTHWTPSCSNSKAEPGHSVTPCRAR